MAQANDFLDSPTSMDLFKELIGKENVAKSSFTEHVLHVSPNIEQKHQSVTSNK